MDKYSIEKVVGEGSYGKALLCRKKADRKQCIIKQISLKKLGAKELKLIQQESMLLSNFKHPNIVSFWESFQEVNRFNNTTCLCIVMEYADGGDLAAYLSRHKPKYLPEKRVLEIFVQISLAIKHVHDRKILHRDLKPQNIFMTSHGMIKLGDFGIAKILKNTGELACTQIGTPYFMSPEIVENRRYNNKTDIWSLGCVMFEVMTYKVPFDGSSMNNLIKNIIQKPMPALPSQYSAELRNLVALMLSKDYRQRPSINSVLGVPVMRNQIAGFLNETLRQKEFPGSVPPPSNANSNVNPAPITNPFAPVSNPASVNPSPAPVVKPAPVGNQAVAPVYKPSEYHNQIMANVEKEMERLRQQAKLKKEKEAAEIKARQEAYALAEQRRREHALAIEEKRKEIAKLKAEIERKDNEKPKVPQAAFPAPSPAYQYAPVRKPPVPKQVAAPPPSKPALKMEIKGSNMEVKPKDVKKNVPQRVPSSKDKEKVANPSHNPNRFVAQKKNDKEKVVIQNEKLFAEINAVRELPNYHDDGQSHGEERRKPDNEMAKQRRQQYDLLRAGGQLPQSKPAVSRVDDQSSNSSSSAEENHDRSPSNTPSIASNEGSKPSSEQVSPRKLPENNNWFDNLQLQMGNLKQDISKLKIGKDSEANSPLPPPSPSVHAEVEVEEGDEIEISSPRDEKDNKWFDNLQLQMGALKQDLSKMKQNKEKNVGKSNQNSPNPPPPPVPSIPNAPMESKKPVKAGHLGSGPSGQSNKSKPVSVSNVNKVKSPPLPPQTNPRRHLSPNSNKSTRPVSSQPSSRSPSISPSSLSASPSVISLEERKIKRENDRKGLRSFIQKQRVELRGDTPNSMDQPSPSSREAFDLTNEMDAEEVVSPSGFMFVKPIKSEVATKSSTESNSQRSIDTKEDRAQKRVQQRQDLKQFLAQKRKEKVVNEHGEEVFAPSPPPIASHHQHHQRHDDVVFAEVSPADLVVEDAELSNHERQSNDETETRLSYSPVSTEPEVSSNVKSTHPHVLVGSKRSNEAETSHYSPVSTEPEETKYEHEPPSTSSLELHVSNDQEKRGHDNDANCCEILANIICGTGAKIAPTSPSKRDTSPRPAVSAWNQESQPEEEGREVDSVTPSLICGDEENEGYDEMLVAMMQVLGDSEQKQGDDIVVGEDDDTFEDEDEEEDNDELGEEHNIDEPILEDDEFEEEGDENGDFQPTKSDVSTSSLINDSEATTINNAKPINHLRQSMDDISPGKLRDGIEGKHDDNEDEGECDSNWSNDTWEDDATTAKEALNTTVCGIPFNAHMVEGLVFEESDSAGVKLEKIRQYLEDVIGEDKFVEAYRLLKSIGSSDNGGVGDNDGDADDDRLLTQLEQIVGIDGLKYLDLFFQLITFEEHY